MSQALRKLTGSISRSKTMMIFLNQIRLKIGVMFGNPETTTGGNALKFYASVRMEIRRIGAIKDREEVTGNQTRVKVVEKQTRAAVPAGRIRYHVRRRHIEGRRTHRPRREGRNRGEIRRLVQL
jgi:RecA protein